MTWRWDQGRLQYFQYDVILRIAAALVGLEGSETGKKAGDLLRPTLERETGLPFLPKTYSVWRNYGRVFALQLLATQRDARLVCTNFCKLLADNPESVTCDEYLAVIAKRFYYPSPAFQGYAPRGVQLFPFCAILKFILSRATVGSPFASLNDIFSYVVGNDCTGTETLDHYLQLKPTLRAGRGDETRQVREMLIFFSQFTFLKWQYPNLYLDVAEINAESLEKIERIATPSRLPRATDPAVELLALGNVAPVALEIPIPEKVFEPEDREFVEGRKVRLVHLRAERSAVLRTIFFRHQRPPYVCDMCEMNVTLRYPWVKNLLEVHHLLPLSSPLHIEAGRTSIRDLVGICPNCHRATHRYYRWWLDDQGVSDFRSPREAREVYENAKEALVVQ